MKCQIQEFSDRSADVGEKIHEFGASHFLCRLRCKNQIGAIYHWSQEKMIFASDLRFFRYFSKRPKKDRNLTSELLALLEQADTVMEVFPQLSRDHVIADLRRTGNLNETIRNAMAERIPQAPKGNIQATKAKNIEIDPKVKEEGNFLNLLENWH